MPKMTAVTNITATILINESLSDIVDLKGMGLLRIQMPAAWTAAELTFQVDDGDGTFRDLYMEWGFELGVWPFAGTCIEASVFLPLKRMTRMKIRSGTSGAPVVQLAERKIILSVGAKS